MGVGLMDGTSVGDIEVVGVPAGSIDGASVGEAVNGDGTFGDLGHSGVKREKLFVFVIFTIMSRHPFLPAQLMEQ